MRPQTSAPPSTRQPFPDGARFDYQIGGAYPPARGVAVVVRDRRAEPAGRYDVCYVNAFQTQPEDASFWLEDHADLLLRVDGQPVEDPDWPGELLLDTAAPDTREALAVIVGSWIAECAAQGYDAIEPDNLDSWTRSQGRLSVADNLAFARLLADRAHAAGLAIGQKNAAELGVTGRDDVPFDFAVVEECATFDECAEYTQVYAGRVLQIEYTDTPNAEAGFTKACAQAGTNRAPLLRDRDVTPAGELGHVSQGCPVAAK